MDEPLPFFHTLGDPGPEQNEPESGPCEHGQGERRDGDQRQRHVGHERPAEPDHRSGDKRAHGGCEAVEQLVEVVRELRLH